ncbi:MAG: sigma-70 family RNA polymerase sigma factor [Solirubrobacteraceae bacterium]
MESAVASPAALEQSFATHRGELVGYCYRMLGSPFDAEDAVQEAYMRAWRGFDRFEGRAALRSWLYRITTNVCLDILGGRERRVRPMDLGGAHAPVIESLNERPEATWIEPIPDPAEVTVARDTLRLAFVAALQQLPPRQRAALILCEVLGWQAAQAAELLETSVAAVNSALQRARTTLAASELPERDADVDDDLLARYVAAFEAYDMGALAEVIHEDATQSMPPFDMWLAGRAGILAWMSGPGSECRGSRLVAAGSANGRPAFGQYKPDPGGGYVPWALHVHEPSGGRFAELTFFLDTARLFPLFGLPSRLDD